MRRFYTLREQRDRLVNKFGEAKADWRISNSRNLCLYPNVYLMDLFSSQIRVFRPLAPNRTEVTIYCIAPKGESAEARAYQEGFESGYMEWNDMSRGAEHWVVGPDDEADKIGLKPILSGIKTEDEGLYVAQHTYWLEQMKKAASAKEQAQ